MVKHTQTIRLPTNCFSVFDHFVKLALKRVKRKIIAIAYSSWISILNSTTSWIYSKLKRNQTIWRHDLFLLFIINTLETFSTSTISRQYSKYPLKNVGTALVFWLFLGYRNGALPWNGLLWSFYWFHPSNWRPLESTSQVAVLQLCERSLNSSWENLYVLKVFQTILWYNTEMRKFCATLEKAFHGWAPVVVLRRLLQMIA